MGAVVEDRGPSFVPPIAAAVGLVALGLYGLTSYPDVAGGDSGELVAAVATGGVIHPPGYPLYALLGRLFSALPVAANVAARVNLLSAVCDAAAVALLCDAVTRWCRSIAAGIAAAAAFALAPVVWKYAICAEVFALNNLLVAALLAVAVRYDAHAERRHALAGALLVGLGMSNHHTFAFVAAPVCAWAIGRGRQDLLRPRVVGQLALATAAGLLPYLYLPLAAAGSATVSWGAANTWPGFWTHVLRREYGTLRLAAPGVAQGASATETLGAWGEALYAQLGAVGVVLAGVGLAARLAPGRRAPLGAVLAGALALSGGVIVVLGNLPVSDALHREIVARFWQQPALLAAVFCGAGVAAVEERFAPRLVGPAAALLLILPVFPRFADANRHGSRVVRGYGAEILRAAPPDALLITKGDLITNTMRYLQSVEGVRADVRVVDQELLGYPWMRPQIARACPDVVIPGARYAPGAPDGFTMKDLIDANVGRGAVLVCGGIKPGDLSSDAAYGRWPFGLCELVERGDRPVDVDAWIRDSEAALPRIDFRGQLHPEGSWEGVVWSDYWEVRQERAAHLIALAGADPGRRRFLGIAADILQGIVDDNPGVPAHVYRNLATALGRKGFDTAGERARAARAWRVYLERGPKSEPQRVAIEREIARLEGR
jgi:hypothetical protein